MIIYIYRMYRWAKKRVGYRSDFCLHCEAQHVAEQYRTFDCGHLYYIPLLPLGFRRHWHCTRCGNNPHERPWGARQWLIFAAVFVGLISLVFWMPLLFIPDGNVESWALRLLFTFCFFALIYGISRSKSPLNLREQLEQVPPLSLNECLYCRGPLDTHGRCAPCGVRRHQVL